MGHTAAPFTPQFTYVFLYGELKWNPRSAPAAAKPFNHAHKSKTKSTAPRQYASERDAKPGSAKNFKTTTSTEKTNKTRNAPGGVAIQATPATTGQPTPSMSKRTETSNGQNHPWRANQILQRWTRQPGCPHCLPASTVSGPSNGKALQRAARGSSKSPLSAPTARAKQTLAKIGRDSNFTCRPLPYRPNEH